MRPWCSFPRLSDSPSVYRPSRSQFSAPSCGPQRHQRPATPGALEAPFPSLQYRRTALANGVRVITETVPSLSSCAIGLWVDVGSRDESAHHHGITHFIEHAVFKGTTQRSARRIAQELEAVGGYLNAFTAKDVTCLYARVRNAHLERALTLLTDLIRNPLFRPSDVEKEKRVIIEEIRGVDDDPEDVINDDLEQSLFGTHPLAHPVLGEESSIDAFSSEGLRDYLTRYHQGRRIVVAAAGGLDHDRLVDACDRLLGDLPMGSRPSRRAPILLPPCTKERSKAVQQVHVILGTAVPGITHPDSDAIAVLSVLFGDSMSSRLFQRIRERHAWAYTVYSALSWYRDVGVFSVFLSTDPQKEARCLDAVEHELRLVQDLPVRESELRRAREQVIGGALLGLESMESRMNRIARDELWFGAVQPLQEWIRRIESISVEDLSRVAALLGRVEDAHRVLIRPGSGPSLG